MSDLAQWQGGQAQPHVIVNTNLRALSMILTINFASDSNYTLNSTNDEHLYLFYRMTDTGAALTQSRSLIVPEGDDPSSGDPDGTTKVYVVDNDTDYMLLVTTASGSGVNVPAGTVALLYCDGTDVVPLAPVPGERAATLSTATGGGEDLSWDQRVYDVELLDDTTFSLTDAPATGEHRRMTVILEQGTGGGYTPTFSGVSWSGGSAPSWSASGTDIVELITVDGGTTVYGRRIWNS